MPLCSLAGADVLQTHFGAAAAEGDADPDAGGGQGMQQIDMDPMDGSIKIFGWFWMVLDGL